jgi:hypothetical protein
MIVYYILILRGIGRWKSRFHGYAKWVIWVYQSIFVNLNIALIVDVHVIFHSCAKWWKYLSSEKLSFFFLGFFIHFLLL